MDINLLSLIHLANEDVFSQQGMVLQRVVSSYDDDEEADITELLLTAYNLDHIRITGYYEHWLPHYLDNDFFSLFRMNRHTFQLLFIALNCQEKIFVGGHQPICMKQALLMTLWWLGKGEVLLSVADKFNVAVSTVYNCTEYILSRNLSLIQKYIVWPDEVEAQNIEINFRGRSGYPGVIGAVDCCNIKFKAPAQQQESYIDKNSNHSIKLQAVVTTDKIFTNIMVGYPGSAHDSRVFQNSQLYLDVENGQLKKYFPEDEYHLVGDKAYPLRKWIITPYRDNGMLNNLQRRHNTYHSITRIVVEHVFGILKSRWRILKDVNVNSVEKTTRIIVACCILHNFCYINSSFWDQYEPVLHENDVENGENHHIAGINKRANITNLLN